MELLGLELNLGYLKALNQSGSLALVMGWEGNGVLCVRWEDVPRVSAGFPALAMDSSWVQKCSHIELGSL